MEKRLAIMGVGSLGTILGAYIAKSGRQIDLIDVNREHVDALNQHGAHVTGNIEMTVPVHAITPDQMEGVYDIFLYMTKQTYNATAIPQMLAHADEHTIICTLQNGLPELAVTAAFDPDRTLGAPVGWGATWKGPGVSALTQDPTQLSFTLGSVTPAGKKYLPELQNILERMGKVTVSDNLMGLRWCKVLMNATFSGMSAAMGGTFGGVLDSDLAMDCVAHIGRENIRAVAASGVVMEPFHLPGDLQVDFKEVFDWQNGDAAKKAACIATCRKLWGGSRKLEASMLQDLQKGRKCEIDAINGVVVETGKKFGVPTPVNDLVCQVVREKEEGRMPVAHAPMERFAALLKTL